MKRILLLAPILIMTMAVGFVIYRSTSVAEGQNPVADVVVTDGAADSAYGIPGDVIFTSPVESVTFSHGTHAVEQGFKCDTCHGSIFVMKAHTAESKDDFNMAGLAAGKYCGSCHSAKTQVAFPSDTQCARCHTGVKGLEEAEASNNNQEG